MTQMEAPSTDAKLPAQPLPDAVSASDETEKLTLVRARRGWVGIDWNELYQFRELLFFMIWRDVKVKYKQAVLGMAWVVFVPIISVFIFYIFGASAGFKEYLPAEVPYSAWLFAGMISWQYIAKCIGDGGLALINQQALMSKIYLPRVFIPAASVGSQFFDFMIMLVITMGIITGFVIFTDLEFTSRMFLLPVMMLIMVMHGLGIALFFSALTVMYRDLRFLIPFAVQMGVWISCVAIPSDIFGDKEWLLAFNPVAGVISGYRSILVGTEWKWAQMATSVGFAPFILFLGAAYFRRVERRFADIV